jgi:amidase
MAKKSFDVLTTTASDLQSLLQDGELTSVEIVDTYQRHIEQYNASLHPIITINPHLAAVARSLDDERRRGKCRGPLHGIPIIVKVCLL